MKTTSKRVLYIVSLFLSVSGLAVYLIWAIPYYVNNGIHAISMVEKYSFDSLFSVSWFIKNILADVFQLLIPVVAALFILHLVFSGLANKKTPFLTISNVMLSIVWLLFSTIFFWEMIEELRASNFIGYLFLFIFITSFCVAPLFLCILYTVGCFLRKKWVKTILLILASLGITIGLITAGSGIYNLVINDFGYEDSLLRGCGILLMCISQLIFAFTLGETLASHEPEKSSDTMRPEE